MSTAKLNHVCSVHRLPMALLIVAGLAGQSPVSQAAGEVIIWDDTQVLRLEPIWDIYSAFFPDSLTGNTVIVSDGPTIDGDAYGGITNTDSDVSDNVVRLSGSAQVNGEVIGGVSRGGNATNNTVTISGGSVGWSVYGGLSFDGNATNNTVKTSGGSVGWSVYGGWSNEGNATNNTVTISGGSLGRSVYGGFSYEGNATDNTVTISGDPQFSATDTSLFGGSAWGGGDTFTNNTLNFSAQPITVNTVTNFQYYNFTLDPSLANTDIAMITANLVELGDTNSIPSEVKVVGIQSGDTLSVGDQFLLMTADNMTGNGVGGTQNAVAQQGISLLYDVETTVDLTNMQITAEILSAGINPQLKSLSEGRLAGLMLATRGADVVADQLYSTIQTENRGGLVPFVLAAGATNRYNSGSHIDSDDFLLTGGLSYRHEGLTAAVFAESGWGNYDTYNSFATMASVRADGNTRYTGGGVFGRYDFTSGLYAEASVRLGNTRTRLDTGDLVNLASGESASYKLNSRYTSAHAGVGYPWVFDDSNLLDVSAKYLWTHINGKDATVAGDPLHFDSVQSQRVRLNGEYRHRHSDSVTLLAGLGYEYEFDAKANGTAYGFAFDAPSLKGSTGILSLGATIAPTSSRRLSVDLRGEGYVGKREGVGGLVRVNYAFM